MKFIATSLVTSSQLVKSIARYCIMFGRQNLFLGKNALLCSDGCNWSLSESINNPEQIKAFSFNCWYFYTLSLCDFIAIRDGQSFLPPLFSLANSCASY